MPTAAAAYLCLGLIFVGRVNTGAAVSERLDDRVRASAYSVLDGVISFGQVVAGLGGGALAEWIGIVPCFVGALLAMAGVAVASRLTPLGAAHARAVS